MTLTIFTKNEESMSFIVNINVSRSHQALLQCDLGCPQLETGALTSGSGYVLKNPIKKSFLKKSVP